MDVVDAYIIYGIKSSFNGSQHVINMPPGGILIDSTCLFALLVPLSIRWI